MMWVVMFVILIIVAIVRIVTRIAVFSAIALTLVAFGFLCGSGMRFVSWVCSRF
jgi:hypothetical protein